MYHIVLIEYSEPNNNPNKYSTSIEMYSDGSIFIIALWIYALRSTSLMMFPSDKSGLCFKTSLDGKNVD